MWEAVGCWVIASWLFFSSNLKFQDSFFQTNSSIWLVRCECFGLFCSIFYICQKIMEKLKFFFPFLKLQINCLYDLDWGTEYAFPIFFFKFIPMWPLKVCFQSHWLLNLLHRATHRHSEAETCRSNSFSFDNRACAVNLALLITITLGSAAKLGATHARTMTGIKHVPEMVSSTNRPTLQLVCSNSYQAAFNAFHFLPSNITFFKLPWSWMLRDAKSWPFYCFHWYFDISLNWRKTPSVCQVSNWDN